MIGWRAKILTLFIVCLGTLFGPGREGVRSGYLRNLTAIHVIQTIADQRFAAETYLGDVTASLACGGRQPLSESIGANRVEQLRAVCKAWNGCAIETHNLSDVPYKYNGNDTGAVTMLAIANAYWAQGFECRGVYLLQSIPHAWSWLYERGHKYALEGDWEKAGPWLARALAVEDNLAQEKADLYRDACMALVQLGKLRQALNACSDFAKIVGSTRDAHHLLGVVYLNLGYYEKARKEFQIGLETESPTHEYYRDLGRALYGLGDRSEAKQMFANALDIHPEDPGSHLYMGIVLLEEGQLSQAENHLQGALRSKSSYVVDTTYLYLGKVASRARRRDEALRYWGLAAQSRIAGIRDEAMLLIDGLSTEK